MRADRPTVAAPGKAFALGLPTMNVTAGRKRLLVLLTCFYGLLPSCSPGVNNVDASVQPFSARHANSPPQHGLHAAFTAALKYLDTPKDITGYTISAYRAQSNACGGAGARPSNSTYGSTCQQLHGSRRFGGAAECVASATGGFSSGSKGLWRALLASMLVQQQQQQQPGTGQVSQRRYLQQLSGLREHSSHIAGLLMLDSSAWAKAPVWELLHLHAPAAMLTLQQLSDAFWTQVSGASGAAATVASALIASRLLLEML